MIRLFILASLISGAVYAQESQDKKESVLKCPVGMIPDLYDNCVSAYGYEFGFGFGFGIGYAQTIPNIQFMTATEQDKQIQAWYKYQQNLQSMKEQQLRLNQMQNEFNKSAQGVRRAIALKEIEEKAGLATTCAQNSDLTLVECSDGKVYKLDASYDQSLRKVVEKDQDASKKASEKTDASSVKQE